MGIILGLKTELQKKITVANECDFFEILFQKWSDEHSSSIWISINTHLRRAPPTDHIVEKRQRFRCSKSIGVICLDRIIFTQKCFRSYKFAGHMLKY